MKSFIISILLLNSFLGFAQDTWQLKKDKQGIKVYTHDYPNSDFKEYRAEMDVSASIDKVKSIILDADNLKNWNYKTSKSRLHKKVDDNNYIIYLYNNMPWPVLNRDHISNINVTYPNSNSVLITISPNNDIIGVQDNIVRITNFKGYWLLTQTDKGTHIKHQLFGDPGGGVPSWLVNMQLVKSPYTSFRNLQNLLKNNPN